MTASSFSPMRAKGGQHVDDREESDAADGGGVADLERRGERSVASWASRRQAICVRAVLLRSVLDAVSSQRLNLAKPVFDLADPQPPDLRFERRGRNPEPFGGAPPARNASAREPQGLLDRAP